MLELAGVLGLVVVALRFGDEAVVTDRPLFEAADSNAVSGPAWSSVRADKGPVVLDAVLNHETDAVALAANPYAAMPSLHAADALLIGLALARLVRARVLTTVWLLWPAWVAFALVASGNHFLLDIAAGALVALIGAALVRAGSRLGLSPPTGPSRTRAAARGGV